MSEAAKRYVSEECIHKPEMIDHDALDSYIWKHYGYGNPHAPYWMIGMEQRAGETEEDIRNRIRIWQEMDAGMLVDVVEYHRRLRRLHLFDQEREWIWINLEAGVYIQKDEVHQPDSWLVEDVWEKLMAPWLQWVR